MKETIKSRKLTLVLFAVYLIVLFWTIVLKFNIQFPNRGNLSGVNLIPYGGDLFPNNKFELGELLLNILLFIPLGLYVGILFKEWSVGKKILLSFLTSLLFEVLQFIYKIGIFDTADLINNTLGGTIGLLIYLATEKAFNNSDKARKLTNTIALTGTTLLLSLILFLKIT
ncbi:VanZ family protein [Algoriphagus sp. A40]|uniref:VanZ family protein n=1 Tax=Algoriphagus sp. A40 TaxID=1945863 RepID=UPI000987B98E|nr:VanZ family protein [Algoriphagus sp. A40]OOG75320.1 hypothetical protein B0E43_10080 [Algoriphagus sp. A40]